MGEVLRLDGGEPDRPTLDRDQFAAYLIMQDLSDATIRAYTPLFVRWVDWSIANGTDPYLPGVLEVRAWSRTLEGGRSILAQGRAMISHLCAALDANDASVAIYLPRNPGRKHRGLDTERAAALAAEAERSGAKGLAVLVAMYTAARREEIASLAWSGINFDAGTVTLTRSKTRDRHTVPMHWRLGQLLQQRHALGEQWVFPGKWGGHVAPNTIWQWVVDVADAAGIGRVTPHQLRHTAITAAYHATKDIRAAQDLAGHTNVQTTVRYTEVHRDRIVAAVNALDYTKETGS